MPGTMSRDGRTLTVPEFSQTQKNAMAQAIARAMVNLSKTTIQEAVSSYLAKEGTP